MITGKTRLLGFFADPHSHSNSPVMYNTSFEKLGLDMRYLAFKIDQDTIGDAVKAMRTLDMVGANVSMPNKGAVMPYLDEISKEAKLCGAVNTIVNKDGFLTGYNTDIYGAVKALEEIGVEISGNEFVLFGLGGAGKAILTGLSMNGARKVSVFLRKPNFGGLAEFVGTLEKETGCEFESCLFEEVDKLEKRLEKAEALINATNVGMGKLEGKTLLPEEIKLSRDLKVMDIIYHPEETELLLQAKKAGCTGVCNGLAMLIYQGEAAFELYTGCKMPIDEVKKAILK